MNEFTNLVSLIIPIFNGEKYLRECLNSICEQTYENIEIILIDDGSTDNSALIAKEFVSTDKRFKFFQFENRGCSAERNFGISICSGDYVGIVDQDDILHKQYVEYFMTLLIKYNVDVATSYKVNSFSGINISNNKLNFNKAELINGNEAAKFMLLNKFIIGPWNKIIKKELLTKNNIKFLENLYCGEGLVFSVDVFQATPFVIVGNDAVYNYRIDNATSGNSTFSVKKLESTLLANEYIKSITKDKSKKMMKIIDYAKWRSKLYYFTLLKITNNDAKFKSLYNNLKNDCKKDAFKGIFLGTSFKQKLNCALFGVFPEFANKLYARRKNNKNKFNK